MLLAASSRSEMLAENLKALSLEWLVDGWLVAVQSFPSFPTTICSHICTFYVTYTLTTSSVQI